MRVDLGRINLLFKTKNINKQPVSSGQGEDERHDTVKGGWTYSKEAEVVDLVREHLQT
jgi:hypothetical protein